MNLKLLFTQRKFKNALIFFGLFFSIILITRKDACTKIANSERGYFYNGIVIAKVESNEQHGSRNVYFDGGENHNILKNLDAYNFIKVGDSVFKIKGETKLYVKRGKVLKMFYLICDGDTIKQ